MSIEAAILELASAIRELAAYTARPAVVVTGHHESVKLPEKTAVEKPAQLKTAAETKQGYRELPAEVPYTDVQALVIKHVATNRAAITQTLEAFGVTTAKALKPEQYADFMAALNTTVAAA